MISAIEKLRRLRAGEGLPCPAGTRQDRWNGADITPGDLPPDWRVEWEERAAIRECDGGQAREHAEAEAFREILERMRAAGQRV